MLADLVAEDLGDEIGRAVHHLVRLGEVGDGVDEADQLDDARDPAEIAERGLEGAEDVDRADARGLPAFLDREIAPELADELDPLRKSSAPGPTRIPACRS